MSKKLKIILFALSLTIIFLFLKSFLTPEEKIIKDKLLELNSLAQFSEKLKLVEGAARSKRAVKFFDNQVKISWSLNEESKFYDFSSEMLRKNALLVYNHLNKFETNLDFKEIAVKGDTAIVKVKASALGSMLQNEGSFFEIHLVNVVLKKKNKEWLVKKITQIRNLRE